MTPLEHEQNLRGRVAIVTGGGRGIGRGIAETLGSRGAKVVVNYRKDAESAAETVAAIEAAGSEAIAIAASMSKIEEADRLAEEALAAFGHVDIVVANAGVASRGLAIVDTDPSELGWVMGVHAFSAHRLIAALLPQMRDRSRGDVVVISSSEVGEHRPNGAPYEMAKAALESMALTLAREEVENGIRANIVAPGLVWTDMGSRLVKATLGIDDVAELDARQPFGRVTRPEDVGKAVAFLVGPDAEMLTGQRIVVDGGAPGAAFAD